MIRTAISPRLAIRIRLNINLPWLPGFYTESRARELTARSSRCRRPFSKWNVAVLAGRILFALVGERLQRADQLGTRIMRHDHFIYIAQLGGLERIRESLAIVLGQTRALDDRVFGLGQLVAKKNVDRLLGPHHGDLGARIREVEIAANMLRRHDVVRTAVSLARDHRHLRHRSLAERVEQFRAVPDNPGELLLSAGQEAGNVDEGDDWNIEGVAEAHESRRFHRR